MARANQGKQNFRVEWRKLLTGSLIRYETYMEVDAAIEAADLAAVGGPDTVQVKVLDDQGRVHLRKTIGTD